VGVPAQDGDLFARTATRDFKKRFAEGLIDEMRLKLSRTRT
jgi:hypothetical protein